MHTTTDVTTENDTIDIVNNKYPPSSGMSSDVSGMRFASKDRKTVCEIKIEIDNVIFSNASIIMGQFQLNTKTVTCNSKVTIPVGK